MKSLSIPSLILCGLVAACAVAPASDPARDAPLTRYSSTVGRTKLKDCLLAQAQALSVEAKAVKTPQGYRVGLGPADDAFALIEGTETDASLRYYRLLRRLDDSSKRDAVIGGCRPR